jgi:galactonate dehydratase
MRRRELILATLGAAAAVPAAAAAKGTDPKVSGLEVFRVRVNHRGNWVLFRVQTDAGITGLGDASHGAPNDAEIAELGKQLRETMRGRSIFDVEFLRRNGMAGGRGRPRVVAFSAFEHCLWDLQGKALGVPMYRLFGGMLNPRIRNYANINRSTVDRTPAGFARNAESAIRAGFDAVKLAPWDGMPLTGEAAHLEKMTQLGIDCAAAVRSAIGPVRSLLLDAHSRFDRARAIDLASRLEPLNLFWLEETCRSVEDLAAVKAVSKMPIAGGESVLGVRGFFEYISASPVHTVMPDIKYCGGLLELKKIAAMAEGAGLLTSPHGPASPVGNMAAAHVCATLPNFQILEFSHGDAPWRAELVDPPEQLQNGCLLPSGRHGLGYELNEKAMRKYAA